MTFRTLTSVAASALAVAVFAPASTWAAPINYGDFSGDTVMYLDVTEDSGTDTPPLYGAPSVFSNSLDFNPVSFNSSSTGAGGVDITDGTLSMMLTSKPGHFISAIKFEEAGDVTLAGFGTDATFASVVANFNVEIQEVDGVGVGSILIQAPMVIAPSNGDFGQLTDGGGGPAYNTAWSGMLMIDIEGALIANNISYVNGATKISVVLDNTLTTVSETGTSSFIGKKDFGGLGITVIPEPATLGLLTLGGVCLLGRRH